MAKRSRENEAENVKIKSFVDMIAPSVIKFFPDYFICGNTYRSVWALREYPTTTEEQAILKHLGEKDGVTLKIYTRHVTAAEERKIISNAANKNRLRQSKTNDLQETVVAEGNLQDVTNLVTTMHRNREPLIHTAVYIELIAHDSDELKELQTEVLTELIRSKLNVDKLMLRQQQGFVSVMPSGYNAFGDQFERVLPASSVANLYPFNYSGKTDANGFYLGRDKYGSNIIVDFNKRADDKTNANILILGNSGQGKSYLTKLIITNLLESGMNIICLDGEHEYVDMANNLGGCFVDLMSGEYLINPLEPKLWSESDDDAETDANTPEAFKKKTKLSQHISFLRDFFGSYKEFTDAQIDTLEIMLSVLLSAYLCACEDGDEIIEAIHEFMDNCRGFVEADEEATQQVTQAEFEAVLDECEDKCAVRTCIEKEYELNTAEINLYAKNDEACLKIKSDNINLFLPRVDMNIDTKQYIAGQLGKILYDTLETKFTPRYIRQELNRYIPEARKAKEPTRTLFKKYFYDIVLYEERKPGIYPNFDEHMKQVIVVEFFKRMITLPLRE